MSALLSIRDLRIAFGDTEVVHGVSLDVARGRVHGLVGESGSGKTVTSRAVLNLLRPPGRVTGGSIAFDGRDLLAQTPREWERTRGAQIAMIFQDPLSALNPSMRVGAQVAETLEAHGVAGDAARRRALELLDRVGIPHAKDRYRSYPHEFSGGQRQRIAIARAIVSKPRVLLADEPVSALDVTTRIQVIELLSRLRAETGMALVMVSHDLSAVAALCERTVVLQGGRVVEEGPTRGVLDSPTTAYTRTLVSAIPRLPREA